MDDNLYPRSGAHLLQEPIEQKLEKEKEAAQVKGAMPILEEIIAYFDKRIVFYESVKSIPDEVKRSPEQFLIAHNSNEQTAINLAVEKNYLEELIRTHK